MLQRSAYNFTETLLLILCKHVRTAKIFYWRVITANMNFTMKVIDNCCIVCYNKDVPRERTDKTTMTGGTNMLSQKNFRANQLKAMHETIRMSNDENLYYRWIMYVPDGATMEDFESIAEDEEGYEEVWELFRELVMKEGIKA